MMTFLSSSARVFLGVEHALAQIPTVVCTGLAGCGAPVSNVLFHSTLPALIRFLASFAGGAAVIFIVVAGVQLLLSWGDESKVTAAKWAVIYAIMGLTLAITSQVIVAFIVTEDYGQGANDFLFAGAMPAVVRIILTLFNVAFVLVIMLAGIRMTYGGGQADEFSKSLNTIKWAIGGAVVTNLAHAAVNALLAIGF